MSDTLPRKLPYIQRQRFVPVDLLDCAPPPLLSALELERSPQYSATLHTGCPVLDSALGGGLPLGLTELCGEASSGKTQLALQLAVQTQLPLCLGGADARVVYVSTEGALPELRLTQMATAAAADAAAAAQTEAAAAAEAEAALQHEQQHQRQWQHGPALPSGNATGAAAAATRTDSSSSSTATAATVDDSARCASAASAAAAAAARRHRARAAACAAVTVDSLCAGVMRLRAPTAGELERVVTAKLPAVLDMYNNTLRDAAAATALDSAKPRAPPSSSGGRELGEIKWGDTDGKQNTQELQAERSNAPGSDQHPQQALASERRISLIVIDSIVYPYRFDYNANAKSNTSSANASTEQLQQQQQQQELDDLDDSRHSKSDSGSSSITPSVHYQRAEALQQLAQALRALSMKYGVPVLVTNHVSDVFAQHDGPGSNTLSAPGEGWCGAGCTCRLTANAFGDACNSAQQGAAPAPGVPCYDCAAASHTAHFLTGTTADVSGQGPLAAAHGLFGGSGGGGTGGTRALSGGRVVSATMGLSWSSALTMRVALSRGYVPWPRDTPLRSCDIRISTRRGGLSSDCGRNGDNDFERVCERPWQAPSLVFVAPPPPLYNNTRDISAEHSTLAAQRCGWGGAVVTVPQPSAHGHPAHGHRPAPSHAVTVVPRSLQVLFAPHAAARVPVAFAVTAEGVRGIALARRPGDSALQHGDRRVSSEEY